MIVSYAVTVIAGVVGALIGSFLNVCISRWPAGQSIVSPPRSRCPHCGRMIRWYENIPVLSWIALRARCAGCGGSISIQYPLVELVTALVWAMTFWSVGIGFTALRLAVFMTVMLGVAVTDALHYVIPDGFTLFGFFFLLATSLIAALQGDTAFFATPWQAFLGACVGAGAISIVGWLGEVAFKKEAMGFGDTTLMAVCGAALGPERALTNVFVAAVLGAVTFVFIVGPIGWLRAKKTGGKFEMPLVPFGVFLAPAAIISLLAGHALMDWYWRLMTP